MRYLREGLIFIGVFVIPLFILPEIGIAQVDPTTQPLVQRSDISYLGSFSVPSQDSLGNPLTYGGYALGYNSVRNSLFFGCHDWYDRVAEVSIPSIGGNATILQPCSDIYEGNPIDNDANGLHPAGNLVYNGRLISTEIAWYDADYTQQTSHGVSSNLNFSDTNNFDGWFGFTGVDAPARALAGYMTLIPSEWRTLFGGPAMTGQAAVSIIGSSSDGPAATVFDPDEVGNSSVLHGTTVVYHPIEHSHPDFNAKGSQIAGMVFPNGTRSVLFWGTRAQHPYCYGTNAECPYSCFMHKGPHNEYKHAIWAYDANDLLRVKNNQLEPWQVSTYAVWEFNDITTGNCASLKFGGATFDQERGRLYVIEDYGENPAVHVYQIGTPTPDTTPPSSPTSLSATSPSQSSISVSWTAATDNVGVTGYIVERCQGSGCSNFAQVGTPTASPFVDTGLTPNTLYNYHVRATDAAGNLSGWSNVVGATTQAPDTTPPSVPASLSAAIVSSSNINLTWTASTDNVGVTGYTLERCSGSGCANFSQVGTPTTNSYSDTGLSASTLYRYRVRATDAANNNSGYSNIASATTPVAPPTPTFVAEYETAWNSSTSPKTTANFSVQSGDILVAYAVNESSTSTIATPPTGTLTGTWTLRQTISATNFTALRLWSMTVASNQTNVNVSFTNASGNWGADVLHFRNASSVGITAQANGNTGNPTLTLNGVSENSTIVMVNGDWSAKTGARTYNTTQAGTFTETSAYADGTSYGVEAGYYANAGTAGNKTIGLTAPTGMTWALAAIEVKGNPTAQPISCNTVTTSNFSQAAYNNYGAPFDAFQTSTNLMDAKCNSADPHTVNLTTGVTGDTTRIVYTKGYWYDPVTAGWRQYTGTCTGALNGEWCQGSVSATITDTNVSTASSTNPTYLVGMTCSVQSGSWKCGCRDTSCTNFSWQIQGAGL